MEQPGALLRGGGGRVHLTLDENTDEDIHQADRGATRSKDEIVAVSEALSALAEESPIKAELVKMRHFAGLSHQDAAGALGISRSTADRHWAYAKAFLFAALQDEDDDREKH